MTRPSKFSWLIIVAGLSAWPNTARSANPDEEFPVATSSVDIRSPDGNAHATRGDAFEARVDDVQNLARALRGDCSGSDPAPVCADFCGRDSTIDLCTLANDHPLTVTAVAAADDALTEIEARLRRAYERARIKLDQELEEQAAAVARAELELEAAQAELATRRIEKARAALQAAKDAHAQAAAAHAKGPPRFRHLHAHFEPEAPAAFAFNSAIAPLTADLGALAMRLAVGLGKLALDRAKQEAMIWALDEINRKVCSPQDDETPELTRELTTYWLPNTCSLVRKEILDHSYGAGNDMLANFVAALEKDLRRAPGSVAGLLLAIGYWAERNPTSPAKLWDCKDQDIHGCGDTKKLRLAATEAVEGVIRGRDPVEQFQQFARELDALNRAIPPKPGLGGRFDAPYMQLGVCAAALAAQFVANDDQVLIPRSAQKQRGVGELELVVAALVASPACWSLVGEGYVWDQLVYKTRRLAAEDQDIERLSSVIRVHSTLSRHRTKFTTLWREINTNAARLDGLKSQTPTAEITAALEASSNEAIVKVLLWKLDLAELGVDTAELFVEFIRDAMTELPQDLPLLFPGLLDSDPNLAPDTAKLERIEEAVGTASGVIRSARAIVEQDWATASVELLALLPADDRSRAQPSKPAKERQRGDSDQNELDGAKLARALHKYLGLFVAILQAKDTDDMAKVLANTAAPPGSWRRKQVPGSFTLSLTSHVGLIGGAELRHGQYGVHDESMNRVYVQAPTLSIPIGFDLAWGNRTDRKRPTSNGVFFPIIDPAAFLQYDVNEAGRLPGPRPLTIFALGALYRLGIPRTPITFLLGYIYRPRLRTWEPTVNEPGADAHQLVISLAVDATLWNLVKR
jgi:hypothetical protein